MCKIPLLVHQRQQLQVWNMYTKFVVYSQRLFAIALKSIICQLVCIEMVITTTTLTTTTLTTATTTTYSLSFIRDKSSCRLLGTLDQINSTRCSLECDLVLFSTTTIGDSIVERSRHSLIHTLYVVTGSSEGSYSVNTVEISLGFRKLSGASSQAVVPHCWTDAVVEHTATICARRCSQNSLISSSGIAS
jgi:hypothetical protein